MSDPLGHLHRVHHMWAFKDLEDRKASRELAWQEADWARTVSMTGTHICISQVEMSLLFTPGTLVKLVQMMDARIMTPLKASPMN